jgi:hypothetical protein
MCAGRCSRRRSRCLIEDGRRERRRGDRVGDESELMTMGPRERLAVMSFFADCVVDVSACDVCTVLHWVACCRVLRWLVMFVDCMERAYLCLPYLLLSILLLCHPFSIE